jgi:SAM-dependent methyltransferase
MISERKTSFLPKDLLVTGLVGLKPWNEYWHFHESRDLPQMHQSNRKGRVRVLGALKKAFGSLVETHLSQKDGQTILEVGCGDGFLREALAPDWLKERLVSLDINLPSLQIAQQNSGGEAPLFLGNAYQLGVADESVDGVVALSSFDSLFFLKMAMEEAARCLKRGERALWVQELVPDLYDDLRRPSPTLATERFQDKMAEAIRATNSLRLVAGENQVVEAMEIEPIQDVAERIPLFEGFEGVLDEAKPLLYTWHEGRFNVLPRSFGTRIPGLGLSWRRGQDRQRLRQFYDLFETQEDPSKVKCGKDEVIEWARLRFLVAEKT